MNKILQLHIQDHPNPEANIGFFCNTISDYYLYKNVYKYLSNTEYIIASMPSETDGNYLKNIAEFFSNNPNIYWRFLNHESNSIQRAEFYSKYAVLISSSYQGDITAEYNKDKKLVRIMDGYTEDSENFGLWNAYFDAVLVNGLYAHNYLSIYSNSVITGNPRFDDFFSQTISTDALKQITSKLSPQKKTILYLPSFGAVSSIDIMITAVQKLSLEYNIILKLPQEFRNNNIDYKRIIPYGDNPHIIILDEKNDSILLFGISDYIITDNRKETLEALLAEKELIIINKTFYKKTGKGMYGFDNGVYDRIHALESTDKQKNKESEEEIGRIVHVTLSGKTLQIPFEKISDALQEVEIRKTTYSKRRMLRKKELFSFLDGTAGKRTAEEIEKILYKPKTHQTFLARALDDYQNYRNSLHPTQTMSNDDHLQESITYYTHIRSMPVFPRIIKVMKDFFLP